jgi:hypothetical protein
MIFFGGEGRFGALGPCKAHFSPEASNGTFWEVKDMIHDTHSPASTLGLPPYPPFPHSASMYAHP